MFTLKEKLKKLVVVVHSFTFSIWETETGGTLWVQSQLGLHCEFQDCRATLKNILSEKQADKQTKQNQTTTLKKISDK